MKWLPLLLLACAPAWAYPPLFQADVPDAAAVTCLYENSTAGHVEEFPVTVNTERGKAEYAYRMCLRSALDWPSGPNAVRLAVRAADGRTSAYAEKTIPRPSGSVSNARLTRSASDSPPTPETPMAAAFRSSSILAFGTGRTNSTITAPAGIQNGDELFIGAWSGESTAGAVVAMTGPAGFTLQPGYPVRLRDVAGTYFYDVYLWRKVASGESGNYTITHSAGQSEGIMWAVSGGDGTIQTTLNSQSNTTGTTTITANGLTTGANDSLVSFFAVAWSDYAGAGSPPAGSTPTFTERIDSGTIYLATGVLATAGATGNKTHTSTNSANNQPWLGALIEVRAAGGGGATSRVPTSPAARLLSTLLPNF